MIFRRSDETPRQYQLRRFNAAADRMGRMNLLQELRTYSGDYGSARFYQLEAASAYRVMCAARAALAALIPGTDLEWDEIFPSGWPRVAHTITREAIEAYDNANPLPLWQRFADRLIEQVNGPGTSPFDTNTMLKADKALKLATSSEYGKFGKMVHETVKEYGNRTLTYLNQPGSIIAFPGIKRELPLKPSVHTRPTHGGYPER